MESTSSFQSTHKGTVATLVLTEDKTREHVLQGQFIVSNINNPVPRGLNLGHALDTEDVHWPAVRRRMRDERPARARRFSLDDE